MYNVIELGTEEKQQNFSILPECGLYRILSPSGLSIHQQILV